MQLEQQVNDEVKIDYGFIRNEGRLTQAETRKERVNAVLAPMLSN